MSKKRELFYIIALVISLLTNVGLFLLPPKQPEPITFQTNVSPLEATIDDEANMDNSQESIVEDVEEEAAPGTGGKASTTSAKTASAPSKITANEPKININTAPLSQLVRLPGVGEATAEKIIEHRTARGGFKRTQDIMLVSGIGEKKFADMQDFITVE